jgi:hypothetical protein
MCPSGATCIPAAICAFFNSVDYLHSEKSLNEENLSTFHKISTLMTSIWYILAVTG